MPSDNLVETYRIVSQSIVAISEKQPPTTSGMPDIPHIIGTGFVVEEGLVVTNDHVVQIGARLPNIPVSAVKNDWPIEVMLFRLIPDKGTVIVILPVLGALTIQGFEVKGAYYGPKAPDLGLLHVGMRGLPRL